MHVIRGSLSDVERDRAVTRQLPEVVEETGKPALRVWTPPRQVAFGRRDAAADGYDRARKAALKAGYEPLERSVGGHAVAYTGQTVAFTYGVPVDGERGGIQRRYESVTERLKRALQSTGATIENGEPDRAFCPGDHSLQHDGKIAGIAQRVQRESALVGGCVVVQTRDEADIASVLSPIYDALGVPFDTESVGSVEGAGGPDVPAVVTDAIERQFAEDGVETISAPTLVE